MRERGRHVYARLTQKSPTKHFGTVVKYVVLSVAVLEVIYLLAANLILGTGLLRQWVSAEKGIKLSYESAHSLLPGRVHVSGLHMEVSDYNVQFQVGLDEADVVISLHELISRRFHAKQVRGSGVTFKMRHNVHDPRANAARLAAFPEIPGYPEPAIYRGPEPPAVSAQKLWTIRLDDVRATVRQLWLLEYHFQGRASVEGGFELQPTRRLWLAPSFLDIESGTVHVGERPLARQFSGRIKCEIRPTDVRPIQGLDIFRSITASVKAQLFDGELAFLDTYLGSHEIEGAFDGDVDLRLQDGRITPTSLMTLTANTTTFGPSDALLNGDLVLEYSVSEDHSHMQIRLLSDRLQGVGKDAPTLHNTELQLSVEPLAVYDPLRVTDRTFFVREVAVPQLAWFQRLLSAPGVHLSGRGKLSMKGAPRRGEIEVSLEPFALAVGHTQVRSDSVQLQARYQETPESLASFRDLELILEGLQVATRDGQSGILRARARSNELALLSDTATARGTVDWTVQPASAVVDLFMGALPAAVTTFLLGLDTIRARVAFHLAPQLKRVELLQANSGGAHLEGTWQSRRGSSERGRFLLETDIKDIGFVVTPDGLQLDLTPPDGFLVNTVDVQQ